MSVDQVAKEAASIAANAPSVSELDGMVEGEAFLTIDALRAGYGKMEILHEFTLRVGRGQSLCLIGPNGAGKSTVLHSIFGFTITMGTCNIRWMVRFQIFRYFVYVVVELYA